MTRPLPPLVATLAGALFACAEAAPVRMGINEAVAVPRAWVENGRLDADGEERELRADAQAARGLGASAVRANSPVYPFLDMQSIERSGWDWTRPDRWMRAVQEAGLDAVVVLGPWPGNRTAAYTDRYLPPNMGAYEDYVRRVVERYDGDGKDDMPGLARPVRSWEVDNEPDLHNSAQPRGGGRKGDPATFETPEEYAQVLVTTARAAREADPGARILSGGLFRPHTPKGARYMQRVLEEPGAAAAFDVLSVHCYFDDDDLATVDRTVAAARALAPGRPFWVTETSVPSNGRRPWADEGWQGRMVAAIAGAFFAGGAEAVFWHTLSDPPAGSDQHRTGGFASNSLLRIARSDGRGVRTDKPAGQVYQRVAARLAGADTGALADVSSGGGRALAAPGGWLVYWGTAVAPTGAATAEDLLSGKVAPVVPGASVSAPAWIAVP